MMAALHTDQGLLLSICISVGDIMWLSFSFPNTSSHAFTLSWGMLKTWPEGWRGGREERQRVRSLLESSYSVSSVPRFKA